MQKVGASFVLKKVGDYVMAPPKTGQAEDAVDDAAAPRSAGAPDLDGQVITDEEGRRLGVARRVANVGVYLITGTRSGLDDQIKAAIGDAESGVFFHHDDAGRLTGLIYVPAQRDQPSDVEATRADDI